jgi:hypothetical protein
LFEYLFSVAAKVLGDLVKLAPSTDTSPMQPMVAYYFWTILNIAGKPDYGMDWCSHFGEFALGLVRSGISKWLTQEASTCVELCLTCPVPELWSVAGGLATQFPEAGRIDLLRQTVAQQVDPSLAFAIILGSSPIPGALHHEWLDRVTEGLRSPDDAVSGAAMRAFRVFRWVELSSPVFFESLQGLEARGWLTIAAVVADTADLIRLVETAGSPGKSFLEGITEWQLYVLRLAAQIVSVSLQSIRILERRARRDGETAELYKEAVPLLVAFFQVATGLIKGKPREIADDIPVIIDMVKGTLTTAFDIPEIIEPAITTLVTLAHAHSANIIEDFGLLWLPLSIILAPDFSPCDKRWTGTILALLKYHLELQKLAPLFPKALERVFVQFTDPSWAERYVLAIKELDPLVLQLTPPVMQLFLDLQVQALAAPWLPQ